MRRRAKGHGNSLREAGEHDCRQSRPFGRYGVDAARNVRRVVGDRRFTILPCHPAGDHPIRAPLVKPVQRLDGYGEPSRAVRNGAQPFELRFRVLRISVETDQDRRRPWSRGRNCQIAAVDGGCDASFGHTAMLPASAEKSRWPSTCKCRGRRRSTMKESKKDKIKGKDHIVNGKVKEK